MICSDEEPLSTEEVPQFEDRPDNPGAFALSRGVVLLGGREPSASIFDRVKQFPRFLLQESTSDLVGARVHINDELPVCFAQRQYRGGVTARFEDPRTRRLRRQWAVADPVGLRPLSGRSGASPVWRSP